jgi:hypothetical protein
MEGRILDLIDVGDSASPGAGILMNWRSYVYLCDDPSFRHIVLLDSPNILGRERWASSQVSEKARAALDKAGQQELSGKYRVELINRVVMGVLTEAALMVAEAEDLALAKGKGRQGP